MSLDCGTLTDTAPLIGRDGQDHASFLSQIGSCSLGLSGVLTDHWQVLTLSGNGMHAVSQFLADMQSSGLPSL
jgi:hypothetical protein